MTTSTDRVGAAAPAAAGETPLRFVTAASLFDGHDAAINVMRRLIQDSGAEVVHLGHNRSVRDVVRAAIQEDADAVAISSYQGGHTEYFKYAVKMLAEAGAERIRVFGGGGGTITPAEIADLEATGVERIYHPNDGMNLGLVGMIDDLVERARSRQVASVPPAEDRHDDLGVARMLSALEDGVLPEASSSACAPPGPSPAPASPWSASPAPAARASRPSPTSCLRASSSTCPSCGSPSSPSTRPAAAPAAPCSATGSG